eukprot:TRINITY_DN10026_c0_g1_i6.p5 TRINITY_DN10026_c0_g1~~TRINITY_DN10026_c0_g1_i6.p5  ORF type:complete len:118 (-),score=4.52 TRINITY_DN10026_c0_g1_i6:559-912(-)
MIPISLLTTPKNPRKKEKKNPDNSTLETVTDTDADNLISSFHLNLIQLNYTDNITINSNHRFPIILFNGQILQQWPLLYAQTPPQKNINFNLETNKKYAHELSNLTSLIQFQFKRLK